VLVSICDLHLCYRSLSVDLNTGVIRRLKLHLNSAQAITGIISSGMCYPLIYLINLHQVGVSSGSFIMATVQCLVVQEIMICIVLALLVSWANGPLGMLVTPLVIGQYHTYLHYV